MTSLLTTLALASYICTPQAYLREEASKQSKVCSEVFYSEKVKVVEKQEKWVKIETVDPHPYTGWVKKKNLSGASEDFFTSSASTVAKVSRLRAHLYTTAFAPDTEYGPIMTLPLESRLKVLEQIDGTEGR